jgi:hypothetical protein
MPPHYPSWRDQPIPYALTSQAEAALTAETEPEAEPEL